MLYNTNLIFSFLGVVSFLVICLLAKHYFENDSETMSSAVIQYPVQIGFNGETFRRDQIIRSFSKLEKLWAVFYLDNVFWHNSNIIVYRFRVYEPLQNFSKRRYIMLTQNIAEAALSSRLHDFGCNVPLDNFVATNIREDVLCVAIASNTDGFSEILKLRQQVY